jgi:ATP-binding cassette, subfamily B, bacterial
MPSQTTEPKKPNKLILLLKPYWKLTLITILLTIGSSGISLFLPARIGQVIDNFAKNPNLDLQPEFILLGVITIIITILALAQTYFSNYFAEKVAFDLRKKLLDKISEQSYQFVNEIGSSTIITATTSDTDNTKIIISQGITAVFTSAILLIGSSTIMLVTNWKLGLIAVGTLPFIGVTFGLIFSRIGKFFRLIQENTTKLNRIISESVFGAALIRVLNSNTWEAKKFQKLNDKSRELTFGIVFLFSSLFPIINLITNFAITAILWFGGSWITQNEFSVGSLSAFLSYYSLLITPIFILGFTSQAISRGLISLENIEKITNSESQLHPGIHEAEIEGNIEVQNLNLEILSKKIIKNFNFEIKAGTRTAILGPTAAGKSQLFSILSSLTKPTSGTVLIDGINIDEWSQESLLSQVGLVFQDSIVFNSSIRDNIAFHGNSNEESVQKAIQTSTLDTLIDGMENGIETIVSERGNSLSGGQKQRLMLARALAVNPNVLLLDDFTARVDGATEKQIWENIKTNYPNITIISITQKIESIKDFDQIIVIEEGEIVGIGKHEELMKNSLEYQMIARSQEVVKV